MMKTYLHLSIIVSTTLLSDILKFYMATNRAAEQNGSPENSGLLFAFIVCAKRT